MTKPRFLELVRVSSAAQQDRDSPQDQRNALDRLRRTRPGILVERLDSTVSGAKDDRRDIARMFELAAAGAFDELRVRHIDRITRHPDPRERAAIFGALADAGAVVVEASGRVIDPRDEMGELDLTLQGWFAARERRRIAERTVAARRRLSEQGRPMTTIPYGRTYDHETGTWGLDAQRVATYRRLFRDTIAGVSLHRLAAALNREGITAPKGGAWEASSIRRMLRNGSAVGRMTSYGHPITCPPVVDEVTQRRALAALARGRTRSGPPATIPALLRKLATCAVCGSTMHVHRGNRPWLLYYRCAKSRQRSGDSDPCTARTYHPVAEVDAALLDALRAEAASPERLIRAATKRRPTRDIEEEAETVRRELERLDRREENLVRMRSQGEVSDPVWKRQQSEIAHLRNAAVERSAALAAALESSKAAREAAADLQALLERMRKRSARASFADWRRIVETLFPRGPGTWIQIHPSGRIVTRGVIRLGGKQGTATCATSQIDLTLRVG